MGDFGVEGGAGWPDHRRHDESQALAYRVALALLSELPFGGVLAALIDFENERQRRIAGDLVGQVANGAGVERLLERVRDSEEVAAVFRQAVDAAARTGYEAKRRALGDLVAMAVLDDAKVDEAALYVLALRDLDAPHLRALERMRRAEDSVPCREDAERLDDSDVTHAVRRVAEAEPAAVNSALERAGVAFRVGTSYGGPPTVGMVSDFGRGLLRYVRETSA